MKKLIFSALAAICLFLSAAIAEPQVFKDFSSAIETGGLSNLVRVAHSRQISPPSIPSNWHLVNRTKDAEEKALVESTRYLGFLLVEALEQESRVQRESPANETLFAQTERLLDFSDWCLQTTGWGNVVLANRARTLCAIASMRLTANTNFPVEKCERLVSRISADTLGPRTRAAAMNADARTNLFALAKVDSNEELDMAFGAGWFLMTFAGKTIPEGFHIPPNKSLNLEAAKANLDFFSDAANTPNSEPPKTAWDERRIGSFRYGFERNLYREAEGLLKFRKEIGHFPKKFVMSKEERNALENEIRLYAKHGMKITPPEEDPSFDPRKEAFRRAWYDNQRRRIEDCNGYVWALNAYRKVISGEYSPHDVRNE